MTLRTVTYDDSTHVLLPKLPTLKMIMSAREAHSGDEYLPISLWKLMLSAAPEYQESENPLDMPLPCDIKIGAGTIKKGCKLSVLVARMNVLYQMAMKTQLGIG